MNYRMVYKMLVLRRKWRKESLIRVTWILLYIISFQRAGDHPLVWVVVGLFVIVVLPCTCVFRWILTVNKRKLRLTWLFMFS